MLKFAIDASNDKNSWTILQQYTATTAPEYISIATYPVPNTNPYRYYRLRGVQLTSPVYANTYEPYLFSLEMFG
jgi:hypothetical protein